MTIDEQVAYLTKGCVDVIRREDLKAKLQRSADGGPPLTVKVGFDPTAPDLHLGHTVLIRKMKHFQDLGHRVVFVVGVFTGLIGDPTGRSKARPPLSQSQIEENAETYTAQVFKILDRERTVVESNLGWLSALGSEGWIRLAARYNVAQMLERREFRQRFDAGKPIAIHEFLYPLAQAYDSVYLKADVELGGTDQLFNLNVGRDIMPSFDVEAQVVLTTPLLVGLDGTEKMSKSAGNYIGITESPNEMFGKAMSISDTLMWDYYELLTDLSGTEIEAMRQQTADGTLHPKQAKVDLARQIITDFHSAADAAAAATEFERRFARGELPTDLAEWSTGIETGGTKLSAIMVAAGLASSASAATRLIDQGGVRVDGERVSDRMHRFYPPARSFVLQVGRKATRVQLLREDEAGNGS